MARKPASPFSKPFLALGLCVFIFAIHFSSPFDSMERRFLDLSFRIRGAQKPHPSILIIEIDDRSLLKMGSWPWPRSNYADLLRILQSFGPKAIFFDMIFTEASQEKEDFDFAKAIQQSGNVVLPFYFSAQNPREYLENAAVPPFPLFRESARQTGYVNVTPDSDGHVREFYPQVANYEHASRAIVDVYQEGSKNKINSSSSLQSQLINFPGPYEVFNRISFDYLVEGYELPMVQSILHSLKRKIVLVGHTAAGTAMDLKPTSFSPQYPGIGLQASMVHTLLSGKFIQKIPPLIYFLLLLLFSFLILRINSISNPLKGFSYTTATLVILFEIIQLAFKYFLLWIPYFGFLILGAILFVVMTLVEVVRIRIEREVLSRELTLASRIQKSFLPTEIPKIPGLQIAAVSFPARYVGGDLYDVTSLPNGKWGICIGDVSGKGVPAAIFMAKMISDFRQEADSGNVSKVLESLNHKIINEGSSGLFLTFLYLMIDPEGRKFYFSNGGHESPLFYQEKNRSVQVLSTQTGVPLGITPDNPFDEREMAGERGDILFLQSDGVREAMNARHEIFGLDRVRSVLLQSASLEPEALIEAMLKHIHAFVKDAPQHDDLTMVCIKFT